MEVIIGLVGLGVVIVVQVIAWIRSSAHISTTLKHVDRILCDHEDRLRELEKQD